MAKGCVEDARVRKGLLRGVGSIEKRDSGDAAVLRPLPKIGTVAVQQLLELFQSHVLSEQTLVLCTVWAPGLVRSIQTALSRP